jgi:hypothetical protein
MYRLGQQLDVLYNGTPGCEIIATPPNPQLFDYKCLADNAGTVKTENYYHDEAYSSYPLGGGSGIKQLCQQNVSGVRHADYARQTKAPTASDCTGLNYVAIGRDGLDWEAFPGLGGAAASMNNHAGACGSSGGYCLTVQQVKDIFVNCTITNWNQLGGPDLAIAVYTAIPGAGTRTAWDAFLGGDSSSCIPAADKATHQIVETFNPDIVANGDAKRAISLASYGTWTGRVKPYPDGSRLGAVDSVFPNKTSLVDGSFPFGRYIYDVYCRRPSDPGTNLCAAGSSSDATVRFVGETGWICKPTAQHSIEPFSKLNYRGLIAQTITKAGFIPLPSGTIGGGAVGKDFCRLFTN